LQWYFAAIAEAVRGVFLFAWAEGEELLENISVPIQQLPQAVVADGHAVADGVLLEEPEVWVMLNAASPTTAERITAERTNTILSCLPVMMSLPFLA
jgi:hypothetical protein